jgi:riboflavin synthase
VLARDPVGDGVELRVGLDEALARYVVVKGSIAVDGVSLTVMSMSTGGADSAPPNPTRSSGGALFAPPDPTRSSGGANSAPPDPPGGPGPDRPWFSVALVPHTLAVTTLGRRQPGDAVQLEVDVLAKYVERLLGPLVPDREV